MKIYSIKGEAIDEGSLQGDFKTARQIGVIRIGTAGLFFRAKLRQYYVPYETITHCFRRVMLVPAKMCCGKGDFQIESLVIGDDNGEMAQIQLPGTRAAQELIKVLKEKMPHADFSAPKKSEETATQGA